MTLYELFQSYGWQLALVGLFGMILIEVTKKPLRNVVTKKAVNSVETTFDTVAFLYGFVVAIILAFAYTLTASLCGWLHAEDGTVVSAGILVYLSNILGTWLYQLVYYQIWKKLGLKRLLELLVKKWSKKLDTNQDGTVDFNEAVQAIQSLISNGKIDVNKVLANVAETAPELIVEAVKDVQQEAGDAAVVNTTASVAKLKASADTLAAKKLSASQAQNVRSATTVATAAANQLIDNPVKAGDSADKPSRPPVKF